MSNKKVIISLVMCATVICMAVAYAAFSTTLTVNGTATISTTWKVEFDTTITSGTATGTATCTAPSYSGLTVALSSSLVKPGDKCVYNLKIKNTGTISATLSTPTISAISGCTVSGSACTTSSGNIKITKGSLSTSSLTASTGYATLPVTIEFVNNTVVQSSPETAKAKITVVATQAS